MSYYIWTTKKNVTRAQAAKIDEAVKAIDPSMMFVRHYAAGNATHGWLERPNDGSNAHNHVRARNARAVAAAEKILA